METHIDSLQSNQKTNDLFAIFKTIFKTIKMLLKLCFMSFQPLATYQVLQHCESTSLVSTVLTPVYIQTRPLQSLCL